MQHANTKTYKMEKIKKMVMSPLFTSAVSAAVALALLMKGDIFYCGIAVGISVCKFMDAFKTI